MSANWQNNPYVDGKPSVGIFRLQMFKPSETFVTMQASALRRYIPTYIGRKRFGPSPAEANVVEFAKHKFSSAASMITGSPGPATRALGGRRVDIIHSHFGIDGVYALELALRRRVPIVTTLHGFDVTTTDQAFLKSGRPALIQYVLRRRKLQTHGDLFICVSNFIREKAIERGFPRDRTVVHYIGNPVIHEEYSAASRSAERPLSVIHVARLVEKKGTRYLLEGIGKLRDSGSNVRLEIVGDGPLRGELEGYVATRGLGAVVTFRGTLAHAQVLAAVANADVLALPSVVAKTGDAEGLGMVLLEAAARGTAIVATNSGGIPEAVVGGETGILVPERDAEALAIALKRFSDEPALVRKMGAAGQALVRSRFNLLQQTDELERIYDQVRAGYASH